MVHCSSRVGVASLAAWIVCTTYLAIEIQAESQWFPSALRGGQASESDSTLERQLIIGGEVAAAGDYPYFTHYDTPGCGGAIIAPDVVLTAAHVSYVRDCR